MYVVANDWCRQCQDRKQGMDNVGVIACLQCDCPSGQVDYLYLQDY